MTRSLIFTKEYSEMGFVKDLGKAALSPALYLLNKNKKKPAATPPLQPTMISTTPYERPISMIGRGRG